MKRREEIAAPWCAIEKSRETIARTLVIANSTSVNEWIIVAEGKWHLFIQESITLSAVMITIELNWRAIRVAKTVGNSYPDRVYSFVLDEGLPQSHWSEWTDMILRQDNNYLLLLQFRSESEFNRRTLQSNYNQNISSVNLIWLNER